MHPQIEARRFAPRGDLEQRLAETSSELGAARAARETDERELIRLRTALAEHDRQLAANGGDHATTVAAQAEEIQHLAAELAALRPARHAMFEPLAVRDGN